MLFTKKKKKKKKNKRKSQDPEMYHVYSKSFECLMMAPISYFDILDNTF